MLPLPLFSSPIDSGTGRGFREKVPGGLPDRAANVYMDVNLVDQAMGQCRNLRLQDPDLRRVVNVRNGVHHSLLSLPSWEELDAIDQALYDYASYECCRLGVLLYANAVIFPIPPQNGWQVRLLEQMVGVLTEDVLDDWAQDGSPFVVWLLVLGGIASFRTELRPFFEKSLRQVLNKRNYLLPKPAVRVAIREFIWSESACGRGFTELWDALDLGSIGELDVG
jgi:hypothetical protein